MPLYEFRCRNCSMTTLDIDRNLPDLEGCTHCNGPLRRIYSSVTTSSQSTNIEPHYNYSLGQTVSSWSDFQSKLNRKSDHQTELTGIEHKYSPIHPADLTANNVGATEEGLT